MRDIIAIGLFDRYASDSWGFPFFNDAKISTSALLLRFLSWCGGECPSTANFCHQCGQQLNLSQLSIG